MSRDLPDNVSSREFDEEPDWLADKPMGWCPWCNSQLASPLKPLRVCTDWHPFETELENRARYAAQREADAHTEERISREARRTGHEPPY
jgi:hypothetical protein